MQQRYEEIYEKLKELPAHRKTLLQNTQVFDDILSLYSEMFSRELANFLLDKMKEGKKERSSCFIL
jgi:hypothetical protein